MLLQSCFFMEVGMGWVLAGCGLGTGEGKA
jgi:hypothetical protein